MKGIVFTVINDLSYDQRMHRICSTMAEAGYDVTLVGRRLPNSKPLREQPYEQKRLFCIFKRGKLFYLEYNLRLLVYLLFKQAKIFSAVDLDTLPACYIVSRMRWKRLVYDAHEYFTEVPELIGRRFEQRVWEKVERWILPKVRHAYTVSESIAKDYEQKYQVPFETIRNVPVLRPYMMEEKQERYLLYQGALNEGRGLEEIIQAMTMIDCELKLAGEGDLSQQLREQVKTLGLQDKVSFLGYVDPRQLRDITAGAYVGLNLLKNKGLSYYYSLANKFFDYIHAGVPGVCANFPEYKLINQEFEVATLTEAQPEAIAAAVNKLLTDKNYYEQLHKNCLKARECFNWQIESQKLKAFYAGIY